MGMKTQQRSRVVERQPTYWCLLNKAHWEYEDECRALEAGSSPSLSVEPLKLRASTSVSVGVAEAFGVVDPILIQRAGTASLCLDHFAHAIDDASDGLQGDAAIEQTHVGTLMLARAVRRYSTIDSTAAFWESWQRYMDEASAAERVLRSRRGSVTEYSPDDLALLGKKSALIKTNAALFAAHSGQWSRLRGVESALELGAIGIQLIDDLFDWREDLEVRDYTYPLSLALRTVSQSRSAAIDKVLDEGDIVDEVVKLSRTYLERSACQFAAVGAAWLASLLLTVTNDLGSYLEEVAAPGRHPQINRQKLLRKYIRPQLGH